jgi:hypothetical protein
MAFGVILKVELFDERLVLLLDLRVGRRARLEG